MRNFRTRGPSPRVIASGKRCQNFTANCEPRLAPDRLRRCPAPTGIVYQKSGDSAAPHWLLKRYVPDPRLDRPKSKWRTPFAHAARMASQYSSMLGQSVKYSFRQHAHGTVMVSLKVSATNPPT